MAPVPAAWLQALVGHPATKEPASRISATGTQRMDRCRIQSKGSLRTSQPFQLYRRTSINDAATTAMTAVTVCQPVTRDAISRIMENSAAISSAGIILTASALPPRWRSHPAENAGVIRPPMMLISAMAMISAP